MERDNQEVGREGGKRMKKNKTLTKTEKTVRKPNKKLLRTIGTTSNL